MIHLQTKQKVEGYHKTYYVFDEDDHTTKKYMKKKIRSKITKNRMLEYILESSNRTLLFEKKKGLII